MNISMDISADLTDMNTGIFSWIISANISVLLKFHEYEYGYELFSRIISAKWPQEIGKIANIVTFTPQKLRDDHRPPHEYKYLFTALERRMS